MKEVYCINCKMVLPHKVKRKDNFDYFTCTNCRHTIKQSDKPFSKKPLLDLDIKE